MNEEKRRATPPTRDLKKGSRERDHIVLQGHGGDKEKEEFIKN